MLHKQINKILLPTNTPQNKKKGRHCTAYYRKNISTSSSFILVICERSLRQCYALKEYCNTVDCFDMNIPSYNKQCYV